MSIMKLQDLGHVWDSMTWIHFNLFLTRAGWSADEIDYERTLLKAIGFTPMLDESDMKARYFTAVRIGAPTKLTRPGRDAVIQLYLNAANHAAYGLRDL